MAERAFGIEIETVICKSDLLRRKRDVLQKLNLAASHWHVVEDKSIETVGYPMHGHYHRRPRDTQGLSATDDEADPFLRCELVSPKLTYCEETTETLEAICYALQHKLDANMNDSCGLHLHFDADDLSINDLIRIGINYAYFEDVIDLLMDKTRGEDSNRYIRSIRKPIYKNFDTLSDILDCKNAYNKTSLSVLDMMNPHRKCHKYNFVNFIYYNLCKIGINKEAKYINTIENRHHHATLHYFDILRWIQFNLSFIHHSKCKLIQSEHIHNDRMKQTEPLSKLNMLAEFIDDDELMDYYQAKLP